MSTKSSSSQIELSPVTKALLDSMDMKNPKEQAMEGQQYSVSQTVSFFGFAYEKIRNAIEFNEEHLIRRFAIARILKRRFIMNSSGKGEGENLVKELLWGRYVPEDSFSHTDVTTFQKIIDSYLLLYKHVTATHKVERPEKLASTIVSLMSCEIEEQLNPKQTRMESSFVYFFYQILREKVQIENIQDDVKDTYFYVAAERAYAKNNSSTIMFHLFQLRYGTLHTQTQSEIEKIAAQFHIFLSETYATLKNPYQDKLVKFAQKQAAPFRILQDIITQHPDDIRDILTDKDKLQETVEATCEARYKQTGDKLRTAAQRSILYIFMTKMIFVLLIEIPLTKLIYDRYEVLSIAINTMFPPVMMGVIVSIINPPSAQNTTRINKRIVQIIDSDPSFETQTALVSNGAPKRNPILFALFSLLYILTFTLVFSSVYFVLDMLGFNIISKGIFIFFISVVTFFAYRIRQTAKEYVLESKSNIITSFITFLFLPILYLGKILSEQVSRINVFIIFFDYLIEAPFKFIIEIIEEWTRFLRDRKDELI